MKYTNYKCPVCNNQFTEDDDVVVCPECGTPHHRECYIQNGNCANADKHGTNEPIEVEFVDVEENNDTSSQTETAEKETENPQHIVVLLVTNQHMEWFQDMVYLLSHLV